jgi:hypothetical protein
MVQATILLVVSESVIGGSQLSYGSRKANARMTRIFSLQAMLMLMRKRAGNSTIAHSSIISEMKIASSRVT